MVDYVELAALAESLIEANGRSVTINKLGTSSLDPNTPWRGRSAPPQVSVTGRAVFVTPGMTQELGLLAKDTDGVKRAEQIAFFAANSATGQALEDFDEIVDNTVTWKILVAHLLRPGSTRLLYLFEVAR